MPTPSAPPPHLASRQPLPTPPTAVRGRGTGNPEPRTQGPGLRAQDSERKAQDSVRVAAGCRGRVLDGQGQELLARGADLDVRVHLRAHAAVEARRPAAVLDLRLVEGVLPVLPQPVLVEARVEVVPGQDLLVGAL